MTSDTPFRANPADASSSQPHPRPDGPFPHDFGRYRLLAYLGGGGMGGVYLADDTRLRIQVAIKVPHPHLAEHEEVLERFYREARAAARLEHPGLCWVSDVGQINDVHYLVMRYVEGCPLRQCGPMGPLEAARLVRSIAQAMAAAHRGGVVHRDLKPSNVIVRPSGDPVVADFGLALFHAEALARITPAGLPIGTLRYMAPEQLRGDTDAHGPACDIYSLGVILYELLAGVVPFQNPAVEVLAPIDEPRPPEFPSQRPQVAPDLRAICLKALARQTDQRYASMDDFAEALDDFLRRHVTAVPEPILPTRPTRPSEPQVLPAAVRFAFVGLGSQAPPAGPPPDRLYLDVGNDLRPGVIDHHQKRNFGGSCARLVLAHPDLITAAATPGRAPDAPFTIIVHEKPDLDCVASAFLAIAWLTTGTFPAAAEALVRYLDRVDEGSLGFSPAQPFSLYAAYQQLVQRSLRRPRSHEDARWRECMSDGLELLSHVLEEAARDDVPLTAVDAFACPGLFKHEDRREIRDDRDRYISKLQLPATRARRARLRLPGQYGGTQRVEALLVRDVQNAGDPHRSIYFKDWARCDADRARNGQGFIALSVFMTEDAQQVRRCVLSVTPASGTSLRGLGEQLDRAEAQRRREIFNGVDDRVVDPATGEPRQARAGYSNADPWYDGRAHADTIVDSPRSGTRLTAEEIEDIFLRYGGSPTPEPIGA